MRLFFVLLAVVAAVVFAAQNAAMVTVTAFFWQLEASLAIIIAICFAVGAIGAMLISMPRLYRMRSHERLLRAQLADLERQNGAKSATEQQPQSSGTDSHLAARGSAAS